MKSFIHNINQYLLERFPNVWNTKIVWMLAISTILHLIFFVFGLVSLTNPKLLHETGASQMFFENGAVYFSIMLSVLLFVIWLISMFKNNAFKNFYPSSRNQLFVQFLFYFIIILASTTFYYSYNFGLKTYISNKYPDSELKKDIHISNMAAVFFSKDIEDYTIGQRRYPDIFSELYCEQNSEFIDTNLPFYKFLSYNYQFYSLTNKEYNFYEKQENIDTGYVFTKRKDSIITYYYRDTVVDVSGYIKSAYPSYYNYKGTFYETDFYYDNTSWNTGYPPLSYDYTYDDYDYYYNRLEYSEKTKANNKRVQELLNRNSSEEIHKILSDFLSVAKKHHIETNLTADKWFELVYHPDDFEVKSLIRIEKNTFDPVLYSDYEKTALETFNIEHTTDYYIRTYDLHNTFENIEDIKSTPVIYIEINFFIWLSFFLAAVIFAFRITGLRPLLFTIITVGMLTVFVALITTMWYYITQSRYNYPEFLILYLIFIISTIILFIPIFFASKLNKQVVAVCLNISIIGFALYVLLIMGIISIHQDYYCRDYYDYKLMDNCFVLLRKLGVYTSLALIIAGFAFMYFYTSVIKKWKALPEG